MGFGWRSKRERAELAVRLYEASVREGTPSKADLLRACISDIERAELCLGWAEEARRKWYQGQRERVVEMLETEAPQYQHMDQRSRIKIGEMKWSSDKVQKELASADQMYTRWADTYYARAQREILGERDVV